MGYLEPELRDNKQLVMARTVAQVSNGRTVARLLNPTEQTLTLSIQAHIWACAIMSLKLTLPLQQTYDSAAQ